MHGNGVQQALKLIESEIKVERTPFKLDCDYGPVKGWFNNFVEKYQVEILSQGFDRLFIDFRY